MGRWMPEAVYFFPCDSLQGIYWAFSMGQGAYTTQRTKQTKTSTVLSLPSGVGEVRVGGERKQDE